MKISHLALPANLGGTLYQRFFSVTDSAAHSTEGLAGSARNLSSRIAISLLCLGSVAIAAIAPPVNLAWTSNPENNITGYRVSYGSTSGVYQNSLNVGTTPSAAISGLSEGGTYFFVVAAVNQAGLQGPASDEVSYQIPTTVLVPTTGWTVQHADSQESVEFQASNAFDGDPSTIWHTAWTGNTTPPPHEIQINLGATRSISGFRYLPRGGAILVGNVGKFEFYVSLDGVNWGNPVASGTFANTSDLKEVRFTETTANYVRFRGLTDANGGTFMSIAELSLIQGASTPPANLPPVAVAKTVSITDNSPVQIMLSGTDPDGNSLTYSVATNPSKGTLSGIAPSLTYTPSANFSGSDSFTYRVNDGNLDSATATVSITLISVNHVPVANSKSVTTTEDTPLAIVLDGTDPDNNSVTFSTVSSPTHGSLSGNAPNLIYTPGPNYNGADQFTFKVNDGNLNSSVATISITVSAVNDAPVVTSKAVSTTIGAALPVNLNGTDLDGDVLTYSVVSGPAHGSLTGTPPSLTYLPASGFSGSDQFTFKANDGKVNSENATISIEVDGITTNLVPSEGWTVHYADSQQSEDYQASNAFDGDSNTIWHTAWSENATPPPHEIQINLGATWSINGFRYLPRSGTYRVGNVGKYEFYTSKDGVKWGSPVASGVFANTQDLKEVRFTETTARYIRFRGLTDANGGTFMSVAEISLVQGVATPPTNQAPFASTQSIHTKSNTPVAIVLSGSDPERSALTFSVVNNPAHGTLAGTAPILTYTPDADFTGDDSFSFRCNDGEVFSTKSLILITVDPATDVPGNHAPQFFPASFKQDATEDQACTGILTATDENAGDTLTYKKLAGPAWLSVSENGNYSGTPLNSNVGDNYFVVKVADQHNASATALLTITVTNTNDAPVFKVSPIICPAGTEKVPYREQALKFSAADPDTGDTISYSIVSGPEWLEIDGSGILIGTPPKDSAGSNDFTIRATDASGAFSEETLQIKINPNTLPLPWKLDRVGKGNLAGPALYSAGIFTVGGAGILDVDSDAGNFSWQTLSGDGKIIARIDKVDDTGASTRVGLMIRDSLDSESRQVFIGLNGKGKLRWLRRANAGDNAIETSSKAPDSDATWLKLERRNNTITAYKSKNGDKWTEVESTKILLPENCYIGLTVSSGNKNQLNTSKFSRVRVIP